MCCDYDLLAGLRDPDEVSQFEFEKNILDTLSGIGLLPLGLRRSISQEDWRSIFNTTYEEGINSLFNEGFEDLIAKGHIDPQSILKAYQNTRTQAGFDEPLELEIIKPVPDTTDNVDIEFELEVVPTKPCSEAPRTVEIPKSTIPETNDSIWLDFLTDIPENDLIEEMLGLKRGRSTDLEFDLFLSAETKQSPTCATNSPRAPEPPKKLVVISQEPDVRCSCSKVKCLRMYCKCFAAGVQCGPWCVCISCENNSKRSPEDLSRLRHHLKTARDPRDDACQCKMSFCSNNHCPCFKSGRGCGELCRCYNCNLKRGTHPAKPSH